MKKITIILFCLLIGTLLFGCEEQTTTGNLTVEQSLIKYFDMTYEMFLEHGGTAAQHYHANCFTAQVPDTEITAVFSTSNYDSNYAVVGLENTDKIIRLQGKLSEFFDGIAEDITLDEFVAEIAQNSSIPEYRIEDGGGTAYYVADHYAIIYLDTYTFQISIDESEHIGPDTYAWLSL